MSTSRMRAQRLCLFACMASVACVALWIAPSRSAQAQSRSPAPTMGEAAGSVAADGSRNGGPSPGAGQVVVSGTVPDEATRASIVARLRDLYGADRVVDQLSLGAVVAPPQWPQHIEEILAPSLKQVSHGQLTVQGNTVDIRGEVGSEALRQQIPSDMAQALDPSYTVRNALRVSAQEQAMMDQVLANRIVEFEPGSAMLRPAAKPLLDEMAVAMARLKGRRFEIIGHTDAMGNRAGNVSLSLARAQAVKDYLIAKGLPAESLTTSGMGPDRPVAPNTTEEGRARNRRIEFRVGS